jgi:hypothetical protein
MVARSWAEIVKGRSEAVADLSPEEEPEEAKEDDIDVLEHAEHVAPSAEPEMEPVVSVPCEYPAKVVAEAGTIPAELEAFACESAQDTDTFAVSDAHADAGRLRPGARGSRQCFCHGEVLSMLSHYGWLGVFGEIDHPLAAKHFGRIYVHSKDFVDGQTLAVGDKVCFYLYADSVGLGAEACRVESTSSLRAGASEFIPGATLRADAAEFVPGAAVPTASSVSNMFVRMSRAFDSIPANCYVEMAGVINSAYFEDDSSDDDCDALADADKESVDGFSDQSSIKVSEIIQAAPWKQPKSGKVVHESSTKRASSPGILSDSTDVGLTSESDSESRAPANRTHRAAPLGVVLGFPVFRLPPGLEDEVPVPYGVS